MHTLIIPQHSDPVARFGLIAAAVALLWLAFWPSQAQPSTAAAQEPIILVATPTLPAPTLAPMGAPAAVEQAPTAQPAGGIATMESPAPQTEEPGGSALVHNPDGSTTLPGSEDWLEPAPDAETNQAPVVPVVDPAVYQSLPIAGQPSASNEAPNYAPRPHTGR